MSIDLYTNITFLIVWVPESEIGATDMDIDQLNSRQNIDLEAGTGNAMDKDIDLERHGYGQWTIGHGDVLLSQRRARKGAPGL